MASTIKSSPILEGKSAEEFINRADSYSDQKTPKLTTVESEQISQFLERSRAFRF